MRFLFVDIVTEAQQAHVVGQRRFPAAEPMRYLGHDGQMQVAPGAVSEAIGQLASWLCLARNDFTARPVFLFADRIDVQGVVPVGSTVELSSTIAEMDEKSFRFSGEAKVNGKTVQTIRDCSGYFMPLAELEDPEVTKSRYNALTTGGLILPGAEGEPFAFSSLAGETVALELGQMVKTRKSFSASERFYSDHFPRFPVTPIVMLNEMIAQATARMLGLPDTSNLRARSISDIKIRSFVKPEETCETLVKASGSYEEGGRRIVDAVAEVLKDGRRILRGQYQYEVLG